jgi:hypothetical protein
MIQAPSVPPRACSSSTSQRGGPGSRKTAALGAGARRQRVTAMLVSRSAPARPQGWRRSTKPVVPLPRQASCSRRERVRSSRSASATTALAAPARSTASIVSSVAAVFDVSTMTTRPGSSP